MLIKESDGGHIRNCGAVASEEVGKVEAKSGFAESGRLPIQHTGFGEFRKNGFVTGSWSLSFRPRASSGQFNRFSPPLSASTYCPACRCSVNSTESIHYMPRINPQTVQFFLNSIALLSIQGPEKYDIIETKSESSGLGNRPTSTILGIQVTSKLSRLPSFRPSL